MTDRQQSPDARSSPATEQRLRSNRALPILLVLAVASCAVYAAIAALSRHFAHGGTATDRPIVTVLLLFAVAFAAYVLAIRVAVRASPTRALVAVLVGSAIAFRLILLPSTPIQEVDIYRYLWDGAVLRAGVSPFRYSPQQVRTADRQIAMPEDLSRLVHLRDTQRPLKTVLARVHYGQVPTVYPPVSQLVFAAAAWTTPAAASVPWRIVIMKTWMVGWDLATLWLVFRLLSLTGRPLGWAVLYGWCPLLMKEVANSGHLDAIAVFLTTLSIYLLAKSAGAGQGGAASGTRPSRGAVTLALLSGMALALAVGAKLYPVVLAPLAALVVARRLGWRWSGVMLLLFVTATALVLWPMLPSSAASDPGGAGQGRGAAQTAPTATATPDMDADPQTDTPPVAAQDPSLGLRTFLRRWEMNEFLFLLLLENLKPAEAVPEQERAWFSVLPERFRQPPIAWLQARFSLDGWEAAFWLTRCVTALVFVALALLFARRAGATDDPARWLASAFLTLAWFWLLAPTQNPWYWTWVLPLLPFARSRVWWAMSGLVLIYYLRFWLRYHFPDPPVLGTPYRGDVFFDLVVTWLEYAPWFLALALVWLARRRREHRQVANC